jgi:hypothetical protein
VRRSAQWEYGLGGERVQEGEAKKVGVWGDAGARILGVRGGVRLFERAVVVAAAFFSRRGAEPQRGLGGRRRSP